MQQDFRLSLYVLLIVSLISACAVIKDVKTGEEAYDKKQYDRAIEMLTKEYSQSSNASDKARKSFLIAKSYQFKNDYDAAVPWFENSLNELDRPETILALAQAYKQTEQYSAAINAFTALRNESTDKVRFQKEIDICQMVSKWKASDQPYEYSIESFAGNSEFSDYGLSLDRNGLATFVSDRPSSNNSETYKWTGNAFSDIYSSGLKGNFIEAYPTPINSPDNEGPLWFSKDFSEVYFTKCTAQDLRDDYCRIYVSYFDRGSWTEPEALMFFKEATNYGNPCLTDNDSILIFSSNKEGTDHDLYYAIRQENGWSSAVSMPDYLNSNGNEMFPTVENDTLYFSSDGHPGLGGLDIFKSELRADRSFSPPENLQRPINSGYDDFHLSISERTSNSFKGYFSSSRPGRGGDDILAFEAKVKVIKEEEKDLAEEENEEEFDQSIYLAISLKGRNLDGDIIQLNQSKLSVMRNELETEFDEKNGLFVQEVDSSDLFNYKAQAPEYLSKSGEISIMEKLSEELSTDEIITINYNIILDPLVFNEEILLDNIYYDFNKWDIREDAKPALDELSKLLKDNPVIRIQLSSHTDCRGDNAFNLDLSQKRAQSAVAYIISTGIDSDRLNAKGFGEENLAVQCLCISCSEADHQANRRTTFTILGQ